MWREVVGGWGGVGGCGYEYLCLKLEMNLYAIMCNRAAFSSDFFLKLKIKIW